MSQFVTAEEPRLQDDSLVRLDGMGGATSEAFVREVAGHKVFVKFLKREYAADPLYRALFKKEYAIGSRLHHKGIVRYEALHEETDGVWIEQEFVAGETLNRKLESDPKYFCRGTRLEDFTMQLLSVLEYLHFNKIVHLDINPGNLMLRQVDGALTLLDLGFCYTDEYGSILGRTDAFAAPEQFGDAGSRVDCRTDLYAVGMILKTIKVSAYPGRRLPRRLERLMDRCLQEDKEKRPASAEECMRMLRRSKIVSRLSCAAAAVAVLAAAVVLLVHRNSPVFRDANDVLYRIVSEKNRTCWAVGHVQDPDDEHIVYMRSEVPYRGKTYKVTEIGPMAFIDRPDMESVYIPEGITKVAESAFRRDSLISVLTIPESVDYIGQRAFADMVALRIVKLPSSLKRLESETFFDCNSLRRISIPDGVEFIGRDCFVSCWALEDVHLPDSLKVLDRGVFYNCTALRTLSIPAGVKSVGEYAFMNCPSLTDIYIAAPVPPTATTLFDRGGITLHVPAGSAEAYSADPAWNIARIVED